MYYDDVKRFFFVVLYKWLVMWNDYKFRSRFFMVVIGAAGNPNIFYMNDCFLL